MNSGSRKRSDGRDKYGAERQSPAERAPGWKMNKDPLKIIVDSIAKIPLDARVLTHEPQLTIVAVTSSAPGEKLKEIERLGAQVIVCQNMDNNVDLKFLAEVLGSINVDSIMIEGGSTWLSQPLERELWINSSDSSHRK